MFNTENIHTEGSAQYTACKAAHEKRQGQEADLFLGGEVELVEDISTGDMQLSKRTRGTVMKIFTSNQVLVKSHDGVYVTSAASLWKLC